MIRLKHLCALSSLLLIGYDLSKSVKCEHTFTPLMYSPTSTQSFSCTLYSELQRQISLGHTRISRPRTHVTRAYAVLPLRDLRTHPQTHIGRVACLCPSVLYRVRHEGDVSDHNQSTNFFEAQHRGKGGPLVIRQQGGTFVLLQIDTGAAYVG